MSDKISVNWCTKQVKERSKMAGGGGEGGIYYRKFSFMPDCVRK